MPRYLITSRRSATQIVVGYDQRGLLNELLIKDAADETAVEFIRVNTPIQEADVASRFAYLKLVVSPLDVTFEDFWFKYGYKEGKKDAMAYWQRMPGTKRQLAFDHVQRYKDQCARDRKHLMYPATYLRAERWLDHT